MTASGLPLALSPLCPLASFANIKTMGCDNALDKAAESDWRDNIVLACLDERINSNNRRACSLKIINVKPLGLSIPIYIDKIIQNRYNNIHNSNQYF